MEGKSKDWQRTIKFVCNIPFKNWNELSDYPHGRAIAMYLGRKVVIEKFLSNNMHWIIIDGLDYHQTYDVVEIEDYIIKLKSYMRAHLIKKIAPHISEENNILPRISATGELYVCLCEKACKNHIKLSDLQKTYPGLKISIRNEQINDGSKPG